MDLVLGMIAAIGVLVAFILRGAFVGYPLVLCLLIFAFIAWERGFRLRDVVRMAFTGARKAFVVLKIFILIGAITGAWMASGTVPGIVYYGMKYMNPHYFILYAFVVSSAVSFLLGTSLGTVSTVGVALMLMAKNGNINANIAAGAIIAGAYFGDRCSPMSSSANLVANLTETNLYTNIRNMFKSAAPAFVLSLVLYYIISLRCPLSFVVGRLDAELLNIFRINGLVLVPALLVLLLALLRLDIKLAMLLSVLVAAGIGVLFQQQHLSEVVRDIVLGFRLDKASPLRSIVQGGGIISMLKPSFVVFVSCAMAGIFEGTRMFGSIEAILLRAKGRFALFSYTALVSLVTAALGSNQSISLVLTDQLMKKSYASSEKGNYDLAVDLENTGEVLAALIPWNLAALVPTVTMKVSSVGFLPYALYLYLLPLTLMMYFAVRSVREARAAHTEKVG
ncbi:Na+/H+ antiporter, NhaC-like, C-terminal [Acididesulfobacillus acetoxydans]|uniref:Na+/H+ antiporter NhaC n=2 Tax=Acididesulfobacillus acetoxydans TaxID=1561005 RepID=A0A8S0W6E9_9FIRM|nr:Na+/H+ antiporter NhaC family protein [Acididesulfobacillus acetoxydans]CAA7599779.1 Na+/H+ antiporter, NhaC-like, C-terminal [Acididesulfobacillus acetoxydans]CEJ07345.1 Na+/H+ antiporter NhaC [Acididesulfobacillus acetoxydans]